jgi:hypothetical protein
MSGLPAEARLSGQMRLPDSICPERLSVPPVSPKALSGPDERAEIDLTQDERQAHHRAGKKRLGDGDLPQTPRPRRYEPSLANRHGQCPREF